MKKHISAKPGKISKTSVTAIITDEDGIFVALNPETWVASQGETVDEALANLREALELYLEESEDSLNILQHKALVTTVEL